MSSILTVEGVVEPWFRNGSNLQGANVPVSARKPQFLASKLKLIYVLTSNSIEIKKRPQTPVLKKSEKFKMDDTSRGSANALDLSSCFH